MNQLSVTIAGLVITVLSTIFNLAGVDFDAGTLTEAVNACVLIIGVVIAYIGRLRQGDITWYGKKK